MLGERLQELRKDKGLSQTAFGRLMNLSPHTISSYERNCSEPSDEIKVKMAMFFDVTLDYLLGLTNQCSSYRHDEEVLLLNRLTEAERREIRSYCGYLLYKRKREGR